MNRIDRIKTICRRQQQFAVKTDCHMPTAVAYFLILSIPVKSLSVLCALCGQLLHKFCDQAMKMMTALLARW